MKKFIAMVMALALVLALSGCGAKEDPQTNPSPSPDQTGVFSPLSPGDDNLDDNLGTPGASPLAGTPTGSPAPLGSDVDPSSEPGGNAGFDNIDGDSDPDADPLASGTPGITAPTPAPSKAPAVNVALKDYKYETYTDEALGLTMLYPSHWTVETGSNTVSFVEPVTSGQPMRLALSVKGYEDKLTTAQAKTEFTNYLNTIKGSYSKFAKGKIDTKVTFINRRAWNCQYKAQQDGGIIRGYVIMTNVESSNQIVALHFSAPKDKYNKNSRTMFKKVMVSVARAAASA